MPAHKHAACWQPGERRIQYCKRRIIAAVGDEKKVKEEIKEKEEVEEKEEIMDDGARLACKRSLVAEEESGGGGEEAEVEGGGL